MKLLKLAIVILLSSTMFSCSKTDSPIVHDSLQFESYQVIVDSEDLKAQQQDVSVFKRFLTEQLESNLEHLNPVDIAGTNNASRYTTKIGERISSTFVDRLKHFESLDITGRQVVEAQGRVLKSAEDKRLSASCYDAAIDFAELYGQANPASGIAGQAAAFEAYFLTCIGLGF